MGKINRSEMNRIVFKRYKDGWFLHGTAMSGKVVSGATMAITEKDIVDNKKMFSDFSIWIENVLQAYEEDETVMCSCGYDGYPVNKFGRRWEKDDESAKHCGGCGSKFREER